MATKPNFSPVTRTSLNAQVYECLRAELLEGRLRPHQRLKIRDLAAALRVSETPVREAVMQLVRERALLLQSNRSLTVPRLSTAQYLELRRIRLELEGLAAAEAAGRATTEDILALEALHAALVAAEAMAEDPAVAAEAVRLNWHFHSRIYRCAAMPELFGIIEGLWLRTAPLLAYLYPHAPPTYPGRHRHLDMLDALRNRDGAALRGAVQADALEGGARLLRLLIDIDHGRVDEVAALGAAPAALPVVPALRD